MILGFSAHDIVAFEICVSFLVLISIGPVCNIVTDAAAIVATGGNCA